MAIKKTDPQQIARFPEKQHADHNRTDGADTGPDGVSGAHRQRFDRERQEIEADDHAGCRQDAWRQPRPPVRIF